MLDEGRMLPCRVLSIKVTEAFTQASRNTRSARAEPISASTSGEPFRHRPA